MPGLFGLVTMDDVVREVFYDKGWIPRPVKTSFVNDVQPIFQRLTGLQWVNHGLFVVHGFGSPLDAQNAQVLAKLNDASAANAAWRAAVLALFRDPGASGALIEDQIAQVFGDAVDQFFEGPPKPSNSLLAVTKTQTRTSSAGLLEHSTPTGRRTSRRRRRTSMPCLPRSRSSISSAHPCTIVSAARSIPRWR